MYSVLPFTAQEAKKQYHRMVLEFISEKYAPVQSTDEAFAILLGLAFMKKRGD